MIEKNQVLPSRRDSSCQFREIAQLDASYLSWASLRTKRSLIRTGSESSDVATFAALRVPFSRLRPLEAIVFLMDPVNSTIRQAQAEPS